MRSTVVPGIWLWSRWQPERGMDFNGFFAEAADGNLVVDPIEPDDATLADLRHRGVAAVLVTNRDHERATATISAATGADILASALDAPLLSVSVDRIVELGDVVFGWTVLGLDGFKTAGEIALYDAARKTAIVGDAIVGAPMGALTLMPDEKLVDPARAILSARVLRARRIEHLLVGDGACLFGNARDAIGAMLDARDGVAVNRVNLDEARYTVSDGDPTPFGGTTAEIGQLIGARSMGYAAVRLRPGEHYCPYHWHTAEEEFFVVMAGAPTLRTPRGTFALRTGDVIAFPADPNGAHRIWNDDATDALVLMVAKLDPADVCFYPDSRKVLVESSDTLVRDNPQLDYFDGEKRNV